MFLKPTGGISTREKKRTRPPHLAKHGRRSTVSYYINRDTSGLLSLEEISKYKSLGGNGRLRVKRGRAKGVSGDPRRREKRKSSKSKVR